MTATSRLLCIGASFLFAVQALAAGNVEIKAGDIAPDFLGRDIDGNEIRLSDYKDKIVIVSFFASWCEPCRKELPMLESLQRTGAGNGLQVIAVNWKEEKPVFRKLVKLNSDYQLKFVADPRGGAANKYGVKAIPHMFLVGTDGKVSFVSLGYGGSVIDRLIPEVNKALNARQVAAEQFSSAAP